MVFIKNRQFSGFKNIAIQIVRLEERKEERNKERKKEKERKKGT